MPSGEVIVIDPDVVIQAGGIVVAVTGFGLGLTVTVTSFVNGQPVAVVLVTVYVCEPVGGVDVTVAPEVASR